MRAVFLVFPCFFFLLMIGQKVNFTRNVLVLRPRGGRCRTAGGLERLVRQAEPPAALARARGGSGARPSRFGTAFARALGQRAKGRLGAARHARVAERWLAATRSADMETGVAADLQFAPSIEKMPSRQSSEGCQPGSGEALTSKVRPARRGNGVGQRRFRLALRAEGVDVSGRRWQQRIVVNPEMTVFRLVPAGRVEGGLASSQDEAGARGPSGGGEQPGEGSRVLLPATLVATEGEGRTDSEPCWIGLRVARSGSGFAGPSPVRRLRRRK